MYCSNCGYNISKKMIDKALEKDAKNANNINYLAKSFVAIRKNFYDSQIRELKSEIKQSGNQENPALLNQINSLKEKRNAEIKDINDKKRANDMAYFKEVLNIDESRTLKTNDYFVCPRCGKLARNNLNEADLKSLARAGHSEIHRGRNNISTGMCSLMIGLILAIIGFMFFALSFKATNGGVLDTSCVEFYVFIVLVIIGFALIGYGAANFFYGKNKIKNYEGLLRDMNNGAFHQ